MSIRRYSLTLLCALAVACGPPPRPVVPPASLPASRPVKATPKDDKAYWKGRADLIAPPVVASPAALKLPALSRFTLKNGLHVVLLRDATLPLISVQLMVRAGTIDDPAGRVGLADFTASMLRQGVRGKSADVISQEVDMAGAALGAGAGYELMTTSCSARTRVTGLCLKMVADLALRPTFPQKEMGQVRDQLLGTVKSSRDDPGNLARQHFFNMLYGDDHPGGQPMTVTSVRAITRDDLVTFHRRHFVPGAAVLGVSGDIDTAALQKLIRKQFGAWKKRPAPPRKVLRVQDPAAGFRVLLVNKPDLTQSFFTLGHAGIHRTHPEREAVLTMNYTLGGGGFSSRLMKVVRSEGGKTYGIRSSYAMSDHDGSFSVGSFTRNKELVATLALVRKELARFIKTPPTPAEVLAAKGKIAGGFAIRFQTSSGLLSSLLTLHMRKHPVTRLTEFPVRVHALTVEALARAARAHLRPHRLVAAVVGKAAVVAPLLKAAKIPFTRVDYMDPISARERTELANKPKVQITAAQLKAARKVLARALRAAGGRKRLAAIKTLRLAGTFAMGPVKGGMDSQYVLPDHFRVSIKVGPMTSDQVLTGETGYVSMGTRRRDFSPAQVRDARMMIWQLPMLVTLHAMARDVQARLSQDRELTRDKKTVAVEVLARGVHPTTLVYDRKSFRLLRIATLHKGQQRVTRLEKHKTFSGVVVPRKMSVETPSGKGTSMEISRVVINPKITPEDIAKK